MKRQIRTLAEYKALMGDAHDEITGIINKSVQDFNRLQEFANDSFGIGPVSYTNTTRANIIHDHICTRVFSLFYGRENVNVGIFNGVFGFIVNNEFFVRFKKMNPKNFGVSNVRTGQDYRYRYQHPVIHGLSERPTIVYSGYSLDKSGADIKGIYTVCKVGDAIEWFDEHGVIESQQMSIDADDLLDVKSEVKLEKTINRIRLKGNSKRDTGTGE